MDAFRRGLYPILLSGDLEAFQRYLRQWEDVIGDTAELAETPPAVQRRTMAALLRRPQQFNLPPWPRDLVAATSKSDGFSAAARHEPGGPVEPVEPVEVAPERSTESAVDGAAVVAPAVAAENQRDEYAPQPAGEQEAEPVEEAPARYYQADMLTGELIPVSRKVRAHHASKDPAATDVPEARRPKRPKRPRRTASRGSAHARGRRPSMILEQLALWPDSS